jgi:3-oxoacyl-[acyl-carrier-protein] synthase III
MITATITGARIAGIASAVPAQTRSVADLESLFGKEESAKVAKSTGVHSRRVAREGQCTSDLCFEATNKLLGELGWEPSSIQAVIFVSQTPDYRLPATACSLHGRLGLSKSCAALDVNLGCSGFVYGLWMAAQFISASKLQRVLLLTGDTSTSFASEKDRATAPIFSDAGTATALESSPETKMSFALGTDGSGEQQLCVPVGGFRRPHGADTGVSTEQENGNWRSPENLYMNGSEVFAFTLREVPNLVTEILRQSGWDKSVVDYFVFHQANKFMLDYLTKKSGIDAAKAPLSLHDYGNTSSASIPLTVSARLGDKLSEPETRKVVFAGFGVGWSWGACATEISSLILPPVLEVE